MGSAMLAVSSRLAAAAFSPPPHLPRATRVAARAMSSLSRPSEPAHATPIQEGGTVPSVVFKTRVRIDSADANPFDWKDVTSEDYFKGKRTVLFSLPGASTPTCSSTHLPGYEDAYPEIKA